MRINPSKTLDLKAKMLKEYMDPVKSKKFKDIDLARIKLESEVRHMPLSVERMTV